MTYALTSHFDGPGFDSRRKRLFFLLFGRFVLLFFFLTDLKYTGILIAGSFSAFISKIINPQVIHRHPM